MSSCSQKQPRPVVIGQDRLKTVVGNLTCRGDPGRGGGERRVCKAPEGSEPGPGRLASGHASSGRPILVGEKLIQSSSGDKSQWVSIAVRVWKLWGRRLRPLVLSSSSAAGCWKTSSSSTLTVRVSLCCEAAGDHLHCTIASAEVTQGIG